MRAGLAYPDLAHIDTWLFDLDQTLYPHESEIMHRVEARMRDYVVRLTGLAPEEAFALQKQYWVEHGTTLAGLMAYHEIDPHAYLAEVHDISLDGLEPDLDLNTAIAALPGRRLVFTNADEFHAVRVLERLEMISLFDGVFHLGHADLIPKPHPDTFARMMAAHKVDPHRTAFFEDSARNLETAKGLGMTTILVGPKASDNYDGHVDFRSPSLKAFFEPCPTR